MVLFIVFFIDISTSIPFKYITKSRYICINSASFKKKNNLSITEFTQRKRMNIAEQLLLNTDLEIRYIAKTVGYTSPSRFSKLYKRFKGVYPREVKSIVNMAK